MENPEDDADAYEFIAEDEDMDDIIQVEGIWLGEDLMQNYSAAGNLQSSPAKNIAEPQADNNEKDKDKPLSRPASPALNPEQRAALASEMRSRPKIPRTPVSSMRVIKPRTKVDIQVKTDITGKLHIEPRSPTPQGTGEFDHAFMARNKIRRTPK
jgi:hypothetical protein